MKYDIAIISLICHSYLIQEYVIQTLHQMGMLHITTQKLGLLDKLFSSLLHN